MGYDSVKVAWSAVAVATFYDVYKATSATGTYTKAGTANGTSLTVSGLTTGKTYYFKVKAGVFDGTNTTTGKYYSAYKSAKPVPSTPSISAASASYTSIKVSWPAVKGATGYYVYRATSSTGTYSYIGSTTGTSYTNGSRTTGKTYYYKVKAYRTVNGVKVFGKDLAAASRVWSANPARLLGLNKGEIAVGRDADLIVLDRDLELLFTVAGGRIIYRRDGVAT